MIYRAITRRRSRSPAMSYWPATPIIWPRICSAIAPPPARFELPNGIKVLLIENHRLPLVSVMLLAPGAGAAQDPKGKAGLAAYTADLLDEGAGDLDALALSARVDRLGATLQIAPGV